MNLEKLARNLILVGGGIMLCALFYWGIYFLSFTSAFDGVTKWEILGQGAIITCIFYSTGECGIAAGMAPMAGYVAYSPLFFWLGFALLGSGFLVRFSTEKSIAVGEPTQHSHGGQIIALPPQSSPPLSTDGVSEGNEPILQARGLLKRYGNVVALNNTDFDLYPGEILGVIGDNGAGKSTLIKALCGAVMPDHGEILLEGKPVHFRSPQDGRAAGIETVYQNLALSPALSIADNMFLGRELRKPGPLGSFFRLVDRAAMQKFARDKLSELGLMTIQNINQAVETLSGGQRQGVAVARAAAFGSKVVIMDEPTAALGVKESRRVLELIRDVKRRGMPIILISHNMPHVFEVCDRIHIHRLGKRLCVINPKDFSMSDAVAFMTGAKEPPKELMG